MIFSAVCVICAGACAVSATVDDASLMQSSSKLAEDDACADESNESDLASMLQTIDLLSAVQDQKDAIPNGGRIPGRHGPDEGTSQEGAVDFEKVRTLGRHGPDEGTKQEAESLADTARTKARAKRRPPPPAARPAKSNQGDAFNLFDLDGDGQLTRFEIDNVFQLNSPASAEDENSLLQTEEFNAAAAIFDAFDLDGDGAVSREEYDLQQYEAIHAQRRLEMDALRTGTDGGYDAEELQYE